jgi:hypothetical protein
MNDYGSPSKGRRKGKLKVYSERNEKEPSLLKNPLSQYRLPPPPLPLHRRVILLRPYVLPRASPRPVRAVAQTSLRRTETKRRR